MKPTSGPCAALAVAAAVLAIGPSPVHAQFTKRLTQAVQSNAENRAIQKVVEHENKAIDAALSAKLTSADNAAGEGLYTSLKADGRVTLQGVTFKEGTADLDESSAPQLKSLGAMLKAHNDVRLRIEAYADTKDVAVARAQAIRDATVKAYGVDAGRLQTEGYKGKSGEQRLEAVQL
jgi:outer membrane protein OmpA-like peptidoglycan-associated protein